MQALMPTFLSGPCTCYWAPGRTFLPTSPQHSRHYTWGPSTLSHCTPTTDHIPLADFLHLLIRVWYEFIIYAFICVCVCVCLTHCEEVIQENRTWLTNLSLEPRTLPGMWMMPQTFVNEWTLSLKDLAFQYSWNFNPVKTWRENVKSFHNLNYFAKSKILGPKNV